MVYHFKWSILVSSSSPPWNNPSPSTGHKTTMASAGAIFSLVPQSLQAAALVEANPQSQNHTPDGIKALTFPWNMKSKYESRTVSFGKASCHDVILPSGPEGRRRMGLERNQDSKRSRSIWCSRFRNGKEKSPGASGIVEEGG